MSEKEHRERLDASRDNLLIPEERLQLDPAEIPLDELPPDEALVSPPPSASFVESVRRLGVLQAILVEAGPRGAYKVLAGRRRVKAAREAGLESIPAHVVASDGAGRYLVGMVENEQRSENPVFAYRAVREMLDEGHTEHQICEAVGVSKGHLHALLALDNLLPDLRRALQDGDMAVSTARRAAKLPKEEQRKLVAALGEKGRVTGQDVSAVREAQVTATLDALPDEMFDLPEPQDEAEGDEMLGSWRDFVTELAIWTPATELPDEVARAIDLIDAWLRSPATQEGQA